MIFKGRREKSIEPPNQTTLKHLLVESPCISLTSKPAPFFGTWLRSLALCLVSDLGRSEDRPPPNSETLPSKMCVYVYHICKAISKFVYVSEYVPGTSLSSILQSASVLPNKFLIANFPSRPGWPATRGTQEKKHDTKLSTKNELEKPWANGLVFLYWIHPTPVFWTTPRSPQHHQQPLAQPPPPTLGTKRHSKTLLLH